ncbi:MAG: cob(I)yrinic acid a,c-diamide adenosyltransferase [bacterium]
MTRIYTRTGDRGETGLIGGRRVSKDDARVEAYGALDELNSAIGAARAFLKGAAEALLKGAAGAFPAGAADGRADLDAACDQIQRDLFALGAEIAAPGKEGQGPRAAAADVEALERLIDRFDAALPALRVFILPGGSSGGALLHVARTVARRAERRVVTLSRAEPLNPEILRYLNRLADLLFVLARAANARAEVTEDEWRPGQGEGR